MPLPCCARPSPLYRNSDLTPENSSRFKVRISNKRKDEMKTRQWSEERIIGLLQQAEKGETTISALCRAQSVSENTFYKWRQKYGGLQVNEARRLRELEQENSRLKKAAGESPCSITPSSKRCWEKSNPTRATARDSAASASATPSFAAARLSGSGLRPFQHTLWAQRNQTRARSSTNRAFTNSGARSSSLWLSAHESYAATPKPQG